MTARVTHSRVSGAAANPNVLVDGPAWDADHIVTGVREVLTAPRTYYVRVDGSDSTGTGLSNDANAFRTKQKAYDTIADTLDLAGNTVTIQLGNGTYTAGLVTAKGVVGGNGPASIVILGSPTPSNVLIAVTSQDGFGIGETAFGAGTSGQTQITIAGVKITTTTAGNCINASGGSVAVTVGLPGYPIDFGTCAQTHIVGNHNAWVIAGTNNLVSGGAIAHAAALSNSVVALHGTTETFSNSPVFTFYAYADTGGTLFVDGMTYTNKATVTGTRFFAASEGMIYALGNATYLPGNSTGVEYEGGRYIADVGATGIPNFTLGVKSNVVLATGIDTFLTTPSSANLRAALTDETGSGAAYFQGGDIGTPSAGVATNLTGTAAGLTAGDVANAAVIAKVLTGFASGAGTLSSADSILSAIQKLNGNNGLKLPLAGGTLTGNIVFNPTTAGTTGTTTNDSASAGTVGQYIESAVAVGSAVSLTSILAANIASISLTAGDWDVSINGAFILGATTSLTQILVCISTTSATVDLTEGKFAIQNYAPTVFGAVYQSAVVPNYRISLSGTTTIYFVARATFTVSTVGGWGLIRARRAR